MIEFVSAFVVCSIVGLFVFSTLKWLFLKQVVQMSARALMRAGYFILFMTITIPTVGHSLFEPENDELLIVKQVSGSQFVPLKKDSSGNVSLDSQPSTHKSFPLALSIVVFYLIYLLIFFGRYIRGLGYLYQLQKDGIVIRKIGRIQILSHDQVRVPFSFSLFRLSTVILPTSCLSDFEKYRIFLLHEMTHIRQRHTHLSHVFQWIEIVLGWNLFTRKLISLIHETQELSCDEFLLEERETDPKFYGQLLIAAEEDPATLTRLICAHSIVGEAGKKLLRWRIILMVKKKSFKSNFLGLTCVYGSLVFFSGASMAATHILDDGKVTIKEAYQIADESKSKTGIPLYVDEYVVKWLNHFLTDPKGNEWFKKSMSRMPFFKDSILSQIQSRSMPEELLVIPFVESGFKNLPEHVNTVKGAGMWQIIPSTGRRLGLDVNPKADERLNLSKSTRAALDYLELLYDQFGDWRLAMVAYNKGESGLAREIEAKGTDDVTQLRRLNAINDYMSKAMATILILQRPDLVK